MNNSTEHYAAGLDIGSSYVKAVSLSAGGTIAEKFTCKTGYDYSGAVSGLLGKFSTPLQQTGVTGYGRNNWDGNCTVRKTEISALAKAMNHLGKHDCTLVDIGGQDSKILKIRGGKLEDHVLNRRCAAGTGSYLEFIAFRMNMEIAEMNRMAAEQTGYHPMNSFCTVVAGTEILDCIKKNIPLPKLVRGLYASIAERIREMATLENPVYISGGLAAYHPVLTDIFKTVLGIDVTVVPDPQFLAALGIALYAKKENNHERKI
ncbi:MAG: hypothetical protein GY757_61610 [bacterium]|nr:hypothetical protein [bacterium]